MTSMQRCAYLDDIDIDSIDAKLEDGVLTVKAPKVEGKSKSRKIDIK